MYNVEYYDFEFCRVYYKQFHTEKNAKEFAIDCITLYCYHKAVVYDTNGCEIACYWGY